MDDAFPWGEFENWAICEPLFPHAQLVLQYRPHDKRYLGKWARILGRAGWYAQEKGNYLLAAEMLGKALKVWQQLFGPESRFKPQFD